MKKREMYIFMEEMEAIGDTWTLEEVERVAPWTRPLQTEKGLWGCSLTRSKACSGERTGNMGIRKTRSDCTVGAFEKSRGLPAGTIRNSDGRDARSDKKIGTIRRQAEKGKR